MLNVRKCPRCGSEGRLKIVERRYVDSSGNVRSSYREAFVVHKGSVCYIRKSELVKIEVEKDGVVYVGIDIDELSPDAIYVGSYEKKLQDALRRYYMRTRGSQQ